MSIPIGTYASFSQPERNSLVRCGLVVSYDQQLDTYTLLDVYGDRWSIHAWYVVSLDFVVEGATGQFNATLYRYRLGMSLGSMRVEVRKNIVINSELSSMRELKGKASYYAALKLIVYPLQTLEIDMDRH